MSSKIRRAIGVGSYSLAIAIELGGMFYFGFSHVSLWMAGNYVLAPYSTLFVAGYLCLGSILWGIGSLLIRRIALDKVLLTLSIASIALALFAPTGFVSTS